MYESHVPVCLINLAYLRLLAQQKRLEGLRRLLLATLASAGGYVPTPVDKL